MTSAAVHVPVFHTCSSVACKGQAFVEMETVAHAQNLVTYYSTMQPYIRYVLSFNSLGSAMISESKDLTLTLRERIWRSHYT